MSVSCFEESFQRVRNLGRQVVLPYLTAGYPDANISAELIRRTAQAGAAAIEIGFPFSDSIADGPVIQSSFDAVLARGQRLEDVFELVRSVRADVSCPLAAMVSCSIVERAGAEPFMQRARAAGFDGVIIPDVPVEEADPLRAAAGAHGLAWIGLVAPTTTPDRRNRIASSSTGFVYQIAVAGLTGERDVLPAG
ncbi:MAG: tryptophan synthase subunit alpha, partial [Planctomycetota bacterium]